MHWAKEGLVQSSRRVKITIPLRVKGAFEDLFKGSFKASFQGVCRDPLGVASGAPLRVQPIKNQ